MYRCDNSIRTLKRRNHTCIQIIHTCKCVTICTICIYIHIYTYMHIYIHVYAHPDERVCCLLVLLQ